MKHRKDLRMIQRKAEKLERNRLQRIAERREKKKWASLMAVWADHQIKTKSLSDKQRVAIALMTDFVHNYSYEYIATRIGTDLQTITRWRNDPHFIREVDKEIRRRQNFILVHAFRNVNRAILRGSMKDTWQFLKMSGYLKDKVEIDRTGESVEMSDEELQNEILNLREQLSVPKLKLIKGKKSNAA